MSLKGMDRSLWGVYLLAWTSVAICALYVHRLKPSLAHVQIVNHGEPLQEYYDNITLPLSNVVIPPGVFISADHAGRLLGDRLPVRSHTHHVLMGSDLHSVYTSIPWRSNYFVPRVLSKSNHTDLMNLISAVSVAFKELNLTWVMNCGTLVGSYMCHDILPWDDDLDILLQAEDFDKLIQMQKNGSFSKMYGLQFKQIPPLNKIFLMSPDNIRGLKWSWPFMDVRRFHIMNNGTLVRNEDRNKKHRYTIPIDNFFPLHLRPLGSLWLPSPRKPWHVLSGMYGKDRSQFDCYTAKWNHVKEKGRRKKPRASCAHLENDYPFVFRQPLGNSTLETLKLGRKTVYSIIVDETPIPGHTNPYHLNYLNVSSVKV